MKPEAEKVRIDKWLWAVRLFKTRSLAADACKGGKIKQNGIAVKPAYEVKLKDVFTIHTGEIVKTVEVIGLLANRVGAPLVASYMKDLTPKELYEAKKMEKEFFFVKRDRGTGRPTKKERRDIDKLF